MVVHRFHPVNCPRREDDGEGPGGGKSGPLPRMFTSRVAAQVWASTVLAQAALNIGASRLGAIVGVNARLASRWLDPGDTRSMAFADVAYVGGDFARHVLRELAELLERAEHPAPAIAPDKHILNIGSSYGELCSALYLALADNVITPEERVVILRTLRRLEDRAHAFARDLQREERRR
jgi:hypothetical protein